MNYKNAYEELKRLYDILQQENQSLKDRIEKAIEYMEKCKFDKTDKYIPISEYKEYQNLLEILKGDK